LSKNIHDLIFFHESVPEYSEDVVAEEKRVKGQPAQRTWHHFTSDDGKFFAGMWESDPGCWKINYTDEHPLKAGDNFTIPAGFVGEWEVVETTKKIYVIYEPGTEL
jgi:uncharacterized cupin superfamily protein